MLAKRLHRNASAGVDLPRGGVEHLCRAHSELFESAPHRIELLLQSVRLLVSSSKGLLLGSLGRLLSSLGRLLSSLGRLLSSLGLFQLATLLR